MCTTACRCELALELATERTLERQAFGKYLSDSSNVQDWIAESRMEIDPARLLVLQVAWMLDQKPGVVEPGALRAQVTAIKVVAARLQSRVVDRAMQFFGATGLSPDTPLAVFWTWGRALHLMEGPDAVHLRTVARHKLAVHVGVFHDTGAAATKLRRWLDEFHHSIPYVCSRSWRVRRT